MNKVNGTLWKRVSVLYFFEKIAAIIVSWKELANTILESPYALVNRAHILIKMINFIIVR